MNPTEYSIKAKVWLYPGEAAWYFVSIPNPYSKEIKKYFGEAARGWGSLPVKVTLGSTVWKTSIFPDKKLGEYLLPLKAEIRKREKITKDSTISFRIEILV
ncbi:MAG TPA: DUF1905 domain-containing protein [Candidatus Dormibacteraeota bacterium]|nr:DUF1905 domain-containing protein [Candidatus Dormibacteraeota bacterium]